MKRKSKTSQENFSFLVFEKNIHSEIEETNIMIKVIEDQKRKLKNWADQMIEKQDKLLEKVMKYKHELKLEISQRLKLEKQIIQLQEEKSISVPLDDQMAAYPKLSHEEVIMNTKKLLKKLKENELIQEIFVAKADDDLIMDLVENFRLDQAYIKLIQFVCEMVDCTSNIQS